MPAAMPSFKFIGIASISQARKGESDSAKKSTPEMNTQPRAKPIAAELWHDCEGEIGVEPHARSEGDRVVGVKPHDDRARRGRKAGRDEHHADIRALSPGSPG